MTLRETIEKAMREAIQNAGPGKTVPICTERALSIVIFVCVEMVESAQLSEQTVRSNLQVEINQAEKRAEAAEAHVRNHHLEACISCAVTESDLKAAEAALAEREEQWLTLLDRFQQEVQTSPEYKDWSWEKVNDLLVRIKATARCATPKETR